MTQPISSAQRHAAPSTIMLNGRQYIATLEYGDGRASSIIEDKELLKHITDTVRSSVSNPKTLSPCNEIHVLDDSIVGYATSANSSEAALFTRVIQNDKLKNVVKRVADRVHAAINETLLAPTSSAQNRSVSSPHSTNSRAPVSPIQAEYADHAAHSSQTSNSTDYGSGGSPSSHASQTSNSIDSISSSTHSAESSNPSIAKDTSTDTATTDLDSNNPDELMYQATAQVDALQSQVDSLLQAMDPYHIANESTESKEQQFIEKQGYDFDQIVNKAQMASQRLLEVYTGHNFSLEDKVSRVESVFPEQKALCLEANESIDSSIEFMTQKVKDSLAEEKKINENFHTQLQVLPNLSESQQAALITQYNNHKKRYTSAIHTLLQNIITINDVLFTELKDTLVSPYGITNSKIRAEKQTSQNQHLRKLADTMHSRETELFNEITTSNLFRLDALRKTNQLLVNSQLNSVVGSYQSGVDVELSSSEVSANKNNQAHSGGEKRARIENARMVKVNAEKDSGEKAKEEKVSGDEVAVQPSHHATSPSTVSAQNTKATSGTPFDAASDLVLHANTQLEHLQTQVAALSRYTNTGVPAETSHQNEIETFINQGDEAYDAIVEILENTSLSSEERDVQLKGIFAGHKEECLNAYTSMHSLVALNKQTIKTASSEAQRITESLYTALANTPELSQTQREAFQARHEACLAEYVVTKKNTLKSVRRVEKNIYNEIKNVVALPFTAVEIYKSKETEKALLQLSESNLAYLLPASKPLRITAIQRVGEWIHHAKESSTHRASYEDKDPLVTRFEDAPGYFNALSNKKEQYQPEKYSSMVMTQGLLQALQATKNYFSSGSKLSLEILKLELSLLEQEAEKEGGSTSINCLCVALVEKIRKAMRNNGTAQPVDEIFTLGDAVCKEIYIAEKVGKRGSSETAESTADTCLLHRSSILSGLTARNRRVARLTEIISADCNHLQEMAAKSILFEPSELKNIHITIESINYMKELASSRAKADANTSENYDKLQADALLAMMELYIQGSSQIEIAEQRSRDINTSQSPFYKEAQKLRNKVRKLDILQRSLNKALKDTSELDVIPSPFIKNLTFHSNLHTSELKDKVQRTIAEQNLKRTQRIHQQQEILNESARGCLDTIDITSPVVAQVVADFDQEAAQQCLAAMSLDSRLLVVSQKYLDIFASGANQFIDRLSEKDQQLVVKKAINTTLTPYRGIVTESPIYNCIELSDLLLRTANALLMHSRFVRAGASQKATENIRAINSHLTDLQRHSISDNFTHELRNQCSNLVAELKKLNLTPNTLEGYSDIEYVPSIKAIHLFHKKLARGYAEQILQNERANVWAVE